MSDKHLEIWFTTSAKGGRRARFYDFSQHRSLPLPYDKAIAMIAQGQATEVSKPEWAA